MNHNAMHSNVRRVRKDAIQREVLNRDQRCVATKRRCAASKDNQTRLCISLNLEKQCKWCDIVDFCQNYRRRIYDDCINVTKGKTEQIIRQTHLLRDAN